MAETQVRDGYKITELGEIPVEWEITKIGDVIDPYIEKTEVNDQYPVLTSSRKGLLLQTDYYNNRQVTTNDNIGYHVIPYGYVTFRSRSDDGMFQFNMNEIVEKGIVSYFYPVFRFNNQVNSYYLLAYMNNFLNRQLSKEIVGSAQKVLSLKKLNNFIVSLPPLPEQQKIAEILSTVDEQIENTKQLIEKTKEIKKGLMQKLLTKGIEHTEFKETELGEIPVEWKVVRLGNVIHELQAGVSVNSENRPCNIGEVGILKTSSVIKGKFIQSENKVILAEEVQRAKVNPRMNSLIVSRMNTPELVGEVAYIDKDYDQLFLPDRLWLATIDDSFSAKWLSELLTLSTFSRKIKISATGTSNSMKNISKQTFMAIMIIVPPLPEQQKIASILSSIDEQIESYEAEKVKYMELKKGLMQQLLTGKMRVKI